MPQTQVLLSQKETKTKLQTFSLGADIEKNNSNLLRNSIGRYCVSTALQWRHNDHDSVSNHQPHDCLLNRLFRRRSKKTSKLRVAGLCVGNSPGPVNSPHKGPVTRQMFPFDDVIMLSYRPSINIWHIPGKHLSSKSCGIVIFPDGFIKATMRD